MLTRYVSPKMLTTAISARWQETMALRRHDFSSGRASISLAARGNFFFDATTHRDQLSIARNEFGVLRGHERESVAGRLAGEMIVWSSNVEGQLTAVFEVFRSFVNPRGCSLAGLAELEVGTACYMHPESVFIAKMAPTDILKPTDAVKVRRLCLLCLSCNA